MDKKNFERFVEMIALKVNKRDVAFNEIINALEKSCIHDNTELKTLVCRLFAEN